MLDINLIDSKAVKGNECLSDWWIYLFASLDSAVGSDDDFVISLKGYSLSNAVGRTGVVDISSGLKDC